MKNDNMVCVGTDVNQEWMLKWWWKNYSDHNNVPVTFLNYGMSRAGLKFCESRGDIIDIAGNIQKHNWFKKPLGMSLVNVTGTVVYMDIDCEVLKNIDPYFTSIREYEVGLTVDWANDHCKTYRNPPYASGVVVYNQPNTFIQEWSDMCHQVNPAAVRGDQEVMNILIARMEREKDLSIQIKILPDKYQWLRLYKTFDPESYIMHWTGDEGKYNIRMKLLVMGDI